MSFVLSIIIKTVLKKSHPNIRFTGQLPFQESYAVDLPSAHHAGGTFGKGIWSVPKVATKNTKQSLKKLLFALQVRSARYSFSLTCRALDKKGGVLHMPSAS